MSYTTILTITASLIMLSGCTQQPAQVESTTTLPPVDGMNIHMCLMGGGQDCAQILDQANKEKYSAAIKEQCDMMKGMPMCDKYFGK